MQVKRVVAGWDPFTALARMDREFDDLVRRGWSGAHAGEASAAGFVPAVEVRREDRDVVVRLELPGIDPDRDLAIEVDRDTLVISGERRAPADSELLVRELRYGRFRREFALPAGTSAEQVQATYDAGLLDVRVRAVVQPAPTPVRVPVTAGARPAAIEQDAS